MNQKIESVTIGIAVKNVGQAAGWYKTLLGNVATLEPAPDTFELKLTDNVWLQLDDTGYLSVGGGSIVRFEVKDIEAAYKEVKKLTPDAGSIETVEGVVKYFDFTDPAGNRLSYVQLLQPL